MSDPAVMHGVLRHLRRTERRRLYHLLGDRELLTRFLADRDETAFEEVVTRHGPMVRAICRRTLGPTADADDAFQAAFLVLLRKARSIRKGDLLAGWICAVAYRTARQALRRRARIGARERPTDNVPEPVRHDDPPLDWLPLFDAALQRLPAKYRDPVVLCELQGISRRDASVRLGLTEGTLSSRLGRARDLLRRKLSRHGFPLALGSTLAPVVVPEALTASTAAAAIHVSAASVSAIVLTEGVLATMFAAKLKLGALVGTAVLFVGVMAGLQFTGPVKGAGEQPGKENSTPKEASKAVAATTPVTKPKPMTASEYEQFQGNWTVVAAQNGESIGVSALGIDERWRFTGNVLTTGGEIKEDAPEEFKLDIKAKPASIDFTLTSFADNKTGALVRESFQGIYRFEPNGELLIAYRRVFRDSARPTRFAVAPKAGVTMLVLERIPEKTADVRLDFDLALVGAAARQATTTTPPTAIATKRPPLDPAKNADLGKVVGAWELVDVDGQTPEAAAAKLGTPGARTSARWQTLRRLQLLPGNGPRDLVNVTGNTSYVAYADLDATRSPKWFTLHATEPKQATGPAGPTGFSPSAIRLCGIYKLDGEKLVLCLPEAEGSPLLRPTDFKGDGEGGVYLLTFQRAAKNWKSGAHIIPPDPTPVASQDPPIAGPFAVGPNSPPISILPQAVSTNPSPGPVGPAPILPDARTLPPSTTPSVIPAPDSRIPPPIAENSPRTNAKLPPVSADPQPLAAAQSDFDRLQGTWLMVNIDGKGKPSDNEVVNIEFLKDRVLLSDGNHGRFRVDEMKVPHQIIIPIAKKGEPPLVGIYKIEGDRLTIASSNKSSKLIPTDFEQDADVNVEVFERQKAPPAAPSMNPARTDSAPRGQRERDLQKEVDQLREQLKRLENELKERK